MSRQFTQAEVQEITKAEDGLRDVGFDVDHEHASHNADLIMRYFEANPTVAVTVASIYGYIEANKAQFVWRTPAQMEYDKIAAENPAAATQLANWLATQGRVGQLVNTGDQAFENATSLLTELRGRDVNPTTIFQAIGRLTWRVGSKLHFVPKPPKKVPADYKPGMFIEPTKPLWKQDSERREREAAAQESPEVRHSREQEAAKREAEGLRRGYSHAEDQQVSKLFVTDPQTREINWIATKNARLAMLERFANRRATRFLAS